MLNKKSTAITACYWYKFFVRAMPPRGDAKFIPVALYLFYSGLTIA